MKSHVAFFATIGLPFTVILALAAMAFIKLSNKFRDEPIKIGNRGDFDGFKGLAYWLGVSYYIGIVFSCLVMAAIVWAVIT